MLNPWCDVADVGIWYALLLLKFDVLFLLLNFRIAAVIVTKKFSILACVVAVVGIWSAVAVEGKVARRVSAVDPCSRFLRFLTHQPRLTVRKCSRMQAL
jgi:hypothetical protein